MLDYLRWLPALTLLLALLAFCLYGTWLLWQTVPWLAVWVTAWLAFLGFGVCGAFRVRV